MKAIKGTGLVVGTLIAWPLAVGAMALAAQIARVITHSHHVTRS